MSYDSLLALFPPIGPVEMVIIAGVGLLVFGKKLPDVGRSLGKGIVEFKNGLKGVQDDIDSASETPIKPDDSTDISDNSDQ